MKFEKKVFIGKVITMSLAVLAFFGIAFSRMAVPAGEAAGPALMGTNKDADSLVTSSQWVPIGMGIVSLALAATAIGQSWIAAKAVVAVGRNPEAADKIRNTMIVGAAVAETGGLYAMVVAIMMMVM